MTISPALIIFILFVLATGVLLGRQAQQARRQRQMAPPPVDIDPPAAEPDPLIAQIAEAPTMLAQPTGSVVPLPVDPAPIEIAPVAIAPADTAPAPTSAADHGSRPVTTLKGLGPKVAARLGELGVATVADLAGLDEQGAIALDAQLGTFKGRMMRDRWLEQARLLVAGDVKAFEAAFGKLGG